MNGLSLSHFWGFFLEEILKEKKNVCKKSIYFWALAGVCKIYDIFNQIPNYLRKLWASIITTHGIDFFYCGFSKFSILLVKFVKVSCVCFLISLSLKITAHLFPLVLPLMGMAWPMIQILPPRPQWAVRGGLGKFPTFLVRVPNDLLTYWGSGI